MENFAVRNQSFSLLLFTKHDRVKQMHIAKMCSAKLSIDIIYTLLFYIRERDNAYLTETRRYFTLIT